MLNNMYDNSKLNLEGEDTLELEKERFPKLSIPESKPDLENENTLELKEERFHKLSIPEIKPDLENRLNLENIDSLRFPEHIDDTLKIKDLKSDGGLKFPDFEIGSLEELIELEITVSNFLNKKIIDKSVNNYELSKFELYYHMLKVLISLSIRQTESYLPYLLALSNATVSSVNTESDAIKLNNYRKELNDLINIELNKNNHSKSR